MSKWCCFAVVLAVICLSVILLSLEADAHAIADESSPWSAATLEVRIIPSNQQQQNGKIKESCDEANETRLERLVQEFKDGMKHEIDRVLNEVKILVASNLAVLNASLDSQPIDVDPSKQARVSSLVCEYPVLLSDFMMPVADSMGAGNRTPFFPSLYYCPVALF